MPGWHRDSGKVRRVSLDFDDSFLTGGLSRTAATSPQA
jgi:hypothetical protein